MQSPTSGYAYIDTQQTCSLQEPRLTK